MKKYDAIWQIAIIKEKVINLPFFEGKANMIRLIDEKLKFIQSTIAYDQDATAHLNDIQELYQWAKEKQNSPAQ